MAAFALVLTFGLVAVSIWALFFRRKHPVDRLPGPPTLPFVGNALKLANRPRDMAFNQIQQWGKEFFPIFRFWLGNVPVLTPLHPKDVEVILTSSQHITKSHDYEFVSKWLGTGLLTSTGNKWHGRRKMITPTFHFKILEQFIPVFSDKTAILVNLFKQHVNKPEGVDIVPMVTRCALDIICETAMGTNVKAQEGDSKYVKEVYELNDLIFYRMMRPWLFPEWAFNMTYASTRTNELISSLQGFTKNVIQERRAERKKTQAETTKPQEKDDDDDVFSGRRKKTAFLDLLLEVSEEHNTLTDEDIREEVDTFMFEGHDTTAMGMSWALHFLGSNPDVQAKCVEELGEIFSGSDRSPTYTDLMAMKYLERVIKESLRLRPSVFLVARRLDRTLKLGDNEYPANTVIHINIYGIQRNPEFFPDPEKFDPERFTPENSQGRHPYAYIPFSAGPRNCIGQKFAMLEMKNLLSAVLRNFRLESINPEYHYASIPDLILRPKFGIPLKIFPREFP